MRWDSPSRLSLSCCAVWLTVRWSPPDGDAALSHAAGPSATSGCEILLRPESHDKPEGVNTTHIKKIQGREPQAASPH